MAADILLRLAAVPVAAGLQSFLIMKGRDLIMRTWERFAQERLERGREEGRREGVEIGAQLAVRRIRERLAQREAAENGERDDAWLEEILAELSENGNGKSE